MEPQRVTMPRHYAGTNRITGDTELELFPIRFFARLDADNSRMVRLALHHRRNIVESPK